VRDEGKEQMMKDIWTERKEGRKEGNKRVRDGGKIFCSPVYLLQVVYRRLSLLYASSS